MLFLWHLRSYTSFVSFDLFQSNNGNLISQCLSGVDPAGIVTPRNWNLGALRGEANRLRACLAAQLVAGTKRAFLTPFSTAPLRWLLNQKRHEDRVKSYGFRRKCDESAVAARGTPPGGPGCERPAPRVPSPLPLCPGHRLVSVDISWINKPSVGPGRGRACGGRLRSSLRLATAHRCELLRHLWAVPAQRSGSLAAPPRVPRLPHDAFASLPQSHPGEGAPPPWLRILRAGPRNLAAGMGKEKSENGKDRSRDQPSGLKVPGAPAPLLHHPP